MLRSCTSSSESRDGWSQARHCAVAWLATCVLLAGVEVGLRMNAEDLFAREARSFDGHFHLVEREILRAGAPPSVLVMGDSRGMVAVLPRRLEAELDGHGIRGRVANLGLSSGTPFDMWKLIERNPHAVSEVAAVVYFVDAFAWSAPGRVESLGSPRERLAARGSAALLPLLFQSHAARAQLRELLEDFVGGVAASRIPLDRHGRAVDFEVARHGPESYTAFAANQRATRLLSDYAPKAHQLESFLKIAHWCAERRIELVLLELPTRPEYDAAVAERFPRVTAQYGQLLETLASRGLPVRKLTREMLELVPHDFQDADHLSDSGAEKSTRYVAGSLAEQLPPDV